MLIASQNQNQREMSTTNFNTILHDTMPCLICLGFFKTHFIMINVHMNYTPYQLVVIRVARSNYNIRALKSAFSKCFLFIAFFTHDSIFRNLDDATSQMLGE